MKNVSMKKIVARVIVVLVLLFVFYSILHQAIIEPCISMYSKFGLLGVCVYLFVFFVLLCAAVLSFIVFSWALDNA